LKVNYEDEFEKVESRVTWYEKAGYPVKQDESGYPNYQEYIKRHIAPKWTNDKKGVLKGVTMPEANAEVGSQFGAWKEKWNSGMGDGDSVPVAQKFENAKKLLTNEASEKLEIDGKSVPLIENQYPYNASEALKGQWRHEIQALGVDAFNMRMMAEEELLALRDFLLKACVNCNEKVEAAKDDLKRRREVYEREQEQRQSAQTESSREDTHEEHHAEHTD
jgi:hypothetical protein